MEERENLAALRCALVEGEKSGTIVSSADSSDLR
ncbi:MAG: hypothetical protein V1844_25865 [Pseudomonadota bacterium]